MLFRYATGCQTLSRAVVNWRRRKNVQPGEHSRIFYVVFIVSERGRGIAAGKLEKLETIASKFTADFFHLYIITYYTESNLNQLIVRITRTDSSSSQYCIVLFQNINSPQPCTGHPYEMLIQLSRIGVCLLNPIFFTRNHPICHWNLH